MDSPCCPTGSGHPRTLYEVAREIASRLTDTFLADDIGRRPVRGARRKFETDPDWQNLPVFYEYLHGDNGAGIGASHQTGWIGLVAVTTALFHLVDPEQRPARSRDGPRMSTDQEEPLS